MDDEKTDFLLTDEARCYSIVPGSRLVHIRDKHSHAPTLCDLDTTNEQRNHPTYRVGRTRLCSICHDAAIEGEAGIDAAPFRPAQTPTFAPYYVVKNHRARARASQGHEETHHDNGHNDSA